MNNSNVKKYACPGCGYKGIEKGMSKCPNCKKAFSWGQSDKNNTKENRKDTSKDYLLKGYYWIRMLSMLFPAFGIVLLFLNKDYKNNLNRQKSEIYDRFFKNVVSYTSVWVIFIIILIVASIVATKKAQQGV